MNSELKEINKAIKTALNAGITWIDIEIAIEEAREEHDPYYDGDHE